MKNPKRKDDSDTVRETRMVSLLVDYNVETNPERRAALWDEYTKLRAQRSVEFVEYLESKQGVVH